MGSGFFGGGCGNLVSLLLVSNYPAVINYKIFRKDSGVHFLVPSIQKGIKYFLLAKIIFGPAKSLKLREIYDLRLHSELRKY